MVRKKTDPFWVYVEARPNERWKCKFCGSEYSGRASRIKAHFGQVKNRGIEVCPAVHPHVKALALSALRLECTEEGQTSKGTGTENVEEFLDLSDFHPAQDGYQSAYNNYASKEDPRVVIPSPLSAEFQDEETDMAIFFPSDVSLPNSEISNVQQTFPQKDTVGGAAGKTLIENFLLPSPHQSEGNARRKPYGGVRQRPSGKLTAKAHDPEDAAHAYDHVPHKLRSLARLDFPHLYVNRLENFKEILTSMPSTPNYEEDATYSPSHVLEGMDMLQQCGNRSIDAKLNGLKRKIGELVGLVEEKEEELYHLWKKVTTIKNVYKSIEADQRREVYTFQQVNQAEKLIAEVEDLRNPGTKRLSGSVCSVKGAPLLTTNLIGRECEISKVWNYIITNDILRVGVYGMGGVGKTGIVMQIYNKLLEYEAFDNVFWATMPRDFTTYELQDVIGNAVHLDELSNEKNEKIRASMLYRFLTSEKNSVLILDGLWQHFDFCNVGIPTSFNGLKLVITSRSLDVCRMMLCQAEIKIRCLSAWIDQWNIFLDKLRPRMVLSKKVQEIAEKIISTCGGLPLVISTIATRLRGIEHMHEWKDMMEKMKDPNARFKELKNEVIDPLKLSYDSLADEQLQQCFIYCAFYIGSRKSRIRREMIEFLIDVELVSGMDNRHKLYDKANAVLDKLENACLLESVTSIEGGDGELKMHDAIIDMAMHCASDMIPCVVNFGIGVKNILSKEYSFEGLDEISYVMDGREETPNGSPCCSGFSILILHGKSCLRTIPSLIFSLLPNLRIFDLSETSIDEIPDSVGDLVNLTALVLRGCSALQHIPCVQKLRLLKKLDLCYCRSMRKIPDGLESLINLEYLDLYGTCIEELPGRVVSNFAKLQYLGLNYIEPEELEGLHKLETLHCCFRTAKELTRYIPFITDKGPAEYLILVGRLEFSFHQHIEMQAKRYSKAIVLNEPISMKTENCRDSFLLPKNVEILLIFSWASKLIVLSNSVPLENLEALEIHNSNFEVLFGDKNQGFQFPSSLSFLFPNLKRINMTSCQELKCLVALNLDARFALPVLREINIQSCASFEGIIANLSPVQKRTHDFHCIETFLVPDFNNLSTLVPASQSFLQSLRKIEIWNSHIRMLLTTEMFLHLPNLEEIDVCKCARLEEIIMPASQKMPLLAPAATYSSRLTSLHIRECNMMKRLLDNGLLVHLCNLQSIDVSKCERMRELTSTYNEDSSTMSASTSLQRLKILKLRHLTQLGSIGGMKIDSPIEIIEVIDCPKLKRIPLQFSLLPKELRAPHSLKSIYVSDQNWWESLEWESQEIITLLQQYVQVRKE